MAAEPRVGGKAPTLSAEAARFYATVYSAARKGSLAELRRKGCGEEEAEEFFSTALRKVMETVDPIARGFSAPEMVSFIKRSAWRCMIDERRRRGQRIEIELGEVHSLSDPSAESPDEVVEEREAAAIGREALQMLSERDRLIFSQRHQLDLSPEEIVSGTPGLSMRTYRKIIQRANTRVLEAYERIEGGVRCEEMEVDLLRRYVAGEGSDSEAAEVKAHLAHCRACQQAQARMRGYLLDVAGAIAVSAGVGPGTSILGRGVEAPARLAESGWDGVRALAAATGSLRERVRDTFLRLATGAQGSGGDATVGQALTTTSVKVASACAAAVAAGACVASGVLPVGGLAMLGHQSHHSSGHRTKHTVVRELAPRPQSGSRVSTVTAGTSQSEAQGHHTARNKGAESPGTGGSAAKTAERTKPQKVYRPSEAKESGAVTGEELGVEAAGTGRPLSPETTPTPSPPPTSSGSVSSSSAVGPGGSSQGSPAHGSGGSEFGF